MDEITPFHAQHGRQENLTQDWVQRHRSNPLKHENDESHRGLASRLYLLCLGLLQRIFREQRSSKKGSNALREELGKFYLWGEELADEKLDEALEYSEDIKSEVLDSLRSVGKSLLRAYSSSNAIVEPKLPADPREELSCLIDQAQAIISTIRLDSGQDDAGESSGSDTDEGDDNERSSNSFLVRDLAQQTDWLSQLSTAIEESSVRAKAQQKKTVYPPVVPFSVSGPAQIYVGLVQDKFPKAGRKLIERFGEANWQRHVNVRDQLDSETPTAEEPAARSLFRPYSAFHDSGIGTSVPAHTTYAASHTSFRSSASEGAKGSARIPPTPVEVDLEEPFECFLCKMTLSNIRNRIDWKMHVFSDLQPYICTFPDCPNELDQFSSRAKWADHEFSQHRIIQSWKCPECSEKCASSAQWQTHIYLQHSIKYVGGALKIAKNMALMIEQATTIDGEECPLCHIVLNETRRGYVKHVGSHMEEIALITLPRNVDEDEDQISGSTERDTNWRSRSDPTQLGRMEPFPLVTPQSQLTVDEDQRRQGSDPQLQPPESLETSLNRLRQHYPDDNFTSCMRNSTVSLETGLRKLVKPNEPQPENVEMILQPWIKCLDCPGKLYTPDPNFETTIFKTHLQNKVHRERVSQRLRVAKAKLVSEDPAEGKQELEDTGAPKHSEDCEDSMEDPHIYSRSHGQTYLGPNYPDSSLHSYEGSWVFDEVTRYRLSNATVKDWLTEKFPKYEFTDANVQRSLDVFRLWIPRMLKRVNAAHKDP